MSKDIVVSFPSKILKEECSICLESLETSDFVLTSCKHFFHKSCLESWCKKSTTCPLCRKINYKIVSRYDNQGQKIKNMGYYRSCINFIYFIYKKLKIE